MSLDLRCATITTLTTQYCWQRIFPCRSQAAQVQYQSKIDTGGVILRNPKYGREHKGFVWEFG